MDNKLYTEAEVKVILESGYEEAYQCLKKERAKRERIITKTIEALCEIEEMLAAAYPGNIVDELDDDKPEPPDYRRELP